MSFWIAATICVIGIAGLFYLERDRSVRVSKALWLPVFWLGIVGSRPVSAWLGMNQSSFSLEQQLNGSPIDAFVYIVLTMAAAIVVLKRWSRASARIHANLPVIVFFTYCLLSVLWSPVPDVAFKRWTKYVGDLLMVLVVVTDGDTVAAVRRLFSRLGFVLLPVSILLIRYTEIGRGYDPTGNAMNTGVTTNKNTLGLITFILSLGALSSLLAVWIAKDASHRPRRLLAQGTLLAFGVVVLALADSATAIACFACGAVLILATSLPSIRDRPGAVHAIVVTVLLGGGLAMLLGSEVATQVLGRQSNLTGRTEIWKAVLPLVPNPLIGAGFESFWIGPWVPQLWRNLSGWYDPRGLNTSHNGYIEIYLNLGWVGLCLLGLILIGGYRRSVAAFRHDPSVANLMLAFVVTTAIYSVTEAGFRMLTPTWIMLLLAYVASSGPVTILAGSTVPLQAPARSSGYRAPDPEIDRIVPGKIAATFRCRRVNAAQASRRLET
jgi:O-antigen ligase